MYVFSNFKGRKTLYYWLGSIENLCRDIYLRSNMDEHGFIPVTVIANFNRVFVIC